MKKFLSVLLVVMVTVMTFAASVSAASTEGDIITALKSAGVPASYVATAESYMAQSGVDLTAAQIDAVITDINDAVAIAAGETSYAKLTADQKEKIAAEVIDASKILGLTATYAGGGKGLTVSDSTGKALLTVTSEGAIKQTGFDYSIVFIGLAVIGLAGVSAVAAKKLIRRKELKLSAECE